MRSIDINDIGHLIFTTDDGSIIDAGYVLGSEGPRGDRGLQGMRGASGLDSKIGGTGPEGPAGAHISSIVATSPTALVMIMSDNRQITVPIHSALLPAAPTGPTGAVGVGLQYLDVVNGRLVAYLTNGEVHDVTSTTRLRTIPTAMTGSCPVYYDPVTDTLYAVSNP